MIKPSKNVRILMVEDNPAEADLMLDSLEECAAIDHIHIVRDGREALTYLGYNEQGKTSQKDTLPQKLPNLILLDLNLPNLNGREVLAIIKSQPTLKRIPVLIMTSSAAEADIISCYDLGASSYITKPLDLAAYRQIVQKLEAFWFDIAKLPPETAE